MHARMLAKMEELIPLWYNYVLDTRIPAVVDVRRYSMNVHSFFPFNSKKVFEVFKHSKFEKEFASCCRVPQCVVRVRCKLLRVRRWGENMSLDIQIVDEWAIELAKWAMNFVTVPHLPHYWQFRLPRRQCRYGEVLKAENLRSLSEHPNLFVSGVLGIMTLPQTLSISWFYFHASYISKRQY